MGFLRTLLGRDRPPRPEPVRWVWVATGRNQPEADMLANILRQEDIPAFVRGRVAATPEMMSLAPHEVLVPSDRALEAHALIDPMEPLG
jgi:Putative prokaryotic signal transducing protein